MYFGLTDEQLMMQDTVRSVLESECPPLAILEQLKTSVEMAGPWSTLSEMGVPGLLAPEKLGGGGFELLDAALVAEVSGEGALPGPLLGHQLAMLAIIGGGSDEQKERWVPSLASGERVGTIAWAELGDRWDPNSWTVRIENDRLYGQKVHVPAPAPSGLVVVGTAPGGLAVIDGPSTGVEFRDFDGIDRTRPLVEMQFDGAVAEVLPRGSDAANRLRDAGCALLAADAFGCASRIMRETIDYLSEREQFGTRLVQFQGVKHELANMAVELEPTRALWWYAVHALDHVPDEGPRVAAIAKATIGDRAMRIARACVDLHGAIGYAWETPIHLWYKRIMFDRAFLGGSGYHRDRAAELAAW